MFPRSVRSVIRSQKPAIDPERALKEASLKSLRDYRLKKIANRQLPLQPRSA